VLSGRERDYATIENPSRLHRRLPGRICDSSPCIYQGINRSENDLNFQPSVYEREIPDLLHAPPSPPRCGADQRRRSDVAGTCISIIEFLSQCWGGYHSMIVPTDGDSIEVVFWKLLSAFDPDLIFYYSRTVADVKRWDPPQAEKIIQDQLTSFVLKATRI